MKRSLALLLTLLLAVGCLPILALGAPAEDESPVDLDVPVETEAPAPSDDDAANAVTDDVFPQDILDEDSADSDVFDFTVDSNFCMIAPDGSIFLFRSDDSLGEENTELSAQSVSECNHILQPYLVYKTLYDQKDATSHYVYKLYNGKCVYCGYIASGSYTTVESTASHSFGTAKMVGGSHSSPNPAQHTFKYEKTCTKCGYTSTYNVNAGCTAQVCNGKTQALPPEES